MPTPSTISPVGLLAELVTQAVRLTSEAPAFQAWTKSTSAEDAKTRVGVFTYPRTAEQIAENADGGFGIVDLGKVGTFREGINGAWRVRSGSEVGLYFRWYVPAAMSDEDSAIQFLNYLGDFWLFVCENAGKDKYNLLPFTEIESDENGPYRIPEKERKRVGDYWECTLALLLTSRAMKA